MNHPSRKRLIDIKKRCSARSASTGILLLIKIARFSLVALLLSVSACTFTVNSYEDRLDANPGDGVCEDEFGDCTLRAAIMEANELFGPQRVAVPAGTYPLSLEGNEGGDLYLNSNIRLQGAGKDQTIIDALEKSGVIAVGGGEVEIQSLTITGGDAQNGGGINVGSADVTLTDVKLDDNFAFTGGGALAIYEKGYVQGDYVEFENNRVDGAFGGAIQNDGRLVLRDSLIVENKSNRAGAIHNSPKGILNLFNVTVTGNEGTSGSGQVRANSQSVGGINQLGFAVLRNVTITNNEGTGDTGGGGLKSVHPATTVVLNSILADNHRRLSSISTVPSDCVGPLTSDSRYNLIQAPDNCDINGLASTYIIDVDAQLDSLADNGGPTRTHRLLSNSPAIDSGYPFPPGSPAADACRAYDQRGVPRPQTVFSDSQDGICDLGAYEAGGLDSYVQRFVLVNSANDSDIGSLRHGDVLNLDLLPESLSVRVVVSNSSQVESVVFDYDETLSFHTENNAPYSIGGHNGGDHLPFDFGASGENHTLRATPYSQDDGNGAGGGGMAITFTVLNGD